MYQRKGNHCATNEHDVRQKQMRMNRKKIDNNSNNNENGKDKIFHPEFAICSWDSFLFDRTNLNFPVYT